MMKFIGLYFVILFSTSGALANVDISSDIVGYSLSEIHIKGNLRTKESVILQELLVKVGKPLNDEDINESYLRLKNLRIFSNVDLIFSQLKPNSVQLNIIVNERWTTIPIVKVGSGGGSDFYTLGIYDINWFGKFWEVGAQYENLNGNNAGVTWFRNPRAFGRRLLLGYDIWTVIRNREMYDDSGELLSAYTMRKKRINIFAQKEYFWWLAMGAGLDYLSMDLDDSELDQEQITANMTSMFEFSENSRLSYLNLDLRLGRLNYDNYLVEGNETNLQYKIASRSLGSTHSNVEWSIRHKSFITLRENHTFGIGVGIGHTESSLLQDQFYVGGLSEVRGYKDGEFVGSNFWQANIEYRFPSLIKKHVILQHILFIDSGNVADSLSDLLTSKQQAFSSVGTGVRIISPRVYRLNVRIDIAKTFGRRDDIDISFGLQQFF